MKAGRKTRLQGLSFLSIVRVLRQMGHIAYLADIHFGSRDRQATVFANDEVIEIAVAGLQFINTGLCI